MEKKSLKKIHTFGTNDYAAGIVEFKSVTEFKSHVTSLKHEDKPFLLVGGGSNILFPSAYPGIILCDRTQGFEIIEQTDAIVLLRIASGENWHNVVTYCVENNFGGIENLALIPGSVGAAPIQNIGAYGVELEQVVHSVSFYHFSNLKKTTYTRDECRFAYRSSIFKTALKHKVWISEIVLRLSRQTHTINVTYAALAQYLSAQVKSRPLTIQDVYHAVIAIRQSKLPDPIILGNAGSFFKNPVISRDEFSKLQSKFPDLPCWPAHADKVKVPAAWLIEHSGLKGYRNGDVGIHQQHALVLVNYGGATGAEILDLAEMVIQKVEEYFGIRLEPEVSIVF